MSASAVEARGKQAVLKLFDMHMDNEAGPYWSVWNGKDPRFFYKEADRAGGMDYLANICDVLSASQTQSTYILKFHPELNKAKKLDSSSPVDGSFGFKLNDNSDFGQGNQLSGFVRTPNDLILQKLEALEKRLDDEAIGDVPQTMEQQIIGLIQDPGIQAMISGFVQNLFVKPQPYTPYMANQNNSNYQPGNRGIAGVVPVDADAQWSKVNEAANRLLAVDPTIGDTLLKLADMAEKNPKKYNMAKSFL